MRTVSISAALATAALLALSTTACQTGSDEPSPSDTAATAGQLRIVKGEHGPEYSGAKLAIVSPAAEEVVKTDSVIVRATLEGMDLASPTEGEQSKGINFSKEGQHVHVIIDNEPYKAMYATDSFSVGALSEGAHTIRAFPSRSWHESVKAPGAFVAHTFYVRSKPDSAAAAFDPTQPLLTYSRPKGEYKGADANRILLDFYLTNVQLGASGHKVVASIDGNVVDTLTEWVPYFIEGLTDGEHTVKLDLIGPDGQPVAGPYNSTERKITVARDAATASTAGHSGH
jgi:hypothetical protein